LRRIVIPRPFNQHAPALIVFARDRPKGIPFMMLRLFTLALAAVALAACSSGPQRGGPRGGFSGGPVGVNQPAALLAQARDLQAKQGCAKAAPVYRVVSSHGDGHDTAQYELGACLLEIEGESDAETALFRQEALFWLNRAAWAGNARAQGKLAEVLSGAPAYQPTLLPADPVASKAWAIVYDANGTRETFGLRPLSGQVTDHLRGALTLADEEAARARAATFTKISMESFVPTARDDEARREGQDFQGAPEGGRRRPR
jgi:TPR repeat protein